MKEDSQKEWIVTPELKGFFLSFLHICCINIFGKQNSLIKKRPLLIIGDSGVGKSMFIEAYRQIFVKYYPVSKDKVFRLNCAAFSEHLIESELFGHVKGSFTGANADKRGLLEDESSGLIILDEIGELSEAVQAKLLVFIEDGEFRKVGSSKIQRSNVKIIGTTNRGKEFFRDDFWFRFYPVFIPPLHKRRMDLLVLVSLMSSRYFSSLSNTNALRLLAYHWPGNVRELERVVLSMDIENSRLDKIEPGVLKELDLELEDDQEYYDFQGEMDTSFTDLSLDKHTALGNHLIKNDVNVNLLNEFLANFGVEIPNDSFFNDIDLILDSETEENYSNTEKQNLCQNGEQEQNNSPKSDESHIHSNETDNSDNEYSSSIEADESTANTACNDVSTCSDIDSEHREEPRLCENRYMYKNPVAGSDSSNENTVDQDILSQDEALSVLNWLAGVGKSLYAKAKPEDFVVKEKFNNLERFYIAKPQKSYAIVELGFNIFCYIFFQDKKSNHPLLSMTNFGYTQEVFEDENIFYVIKKIYKKKLLLPIINAMLGQKLIYGKEFEVSPGWGYAMRRLKANNKEAFKKLFSEVESTFKINTSENNNAVRNEAISDKTETELLKDYYVNLLKTSNNIIEAAKRAGVKYETFRSRMRKLKISNPRK